MNKAACATALNWNAVLSRYLAATDTTNHHRATHRCKARPRGRRQRDEGAGVNEQVHVGRGCAVGVGVEVELQERAEQPAEPLRAEPRVHIHVTELAVVEEALPG